MSTGKALIALTFLAATAPAARAGSVLSVPLDHPTIQAAIDAALPGDIVEVGAGIWKGDGNRDLTFGGKDIVVRSTGGPAACTLDCEGTYLYPHRAFVFEGGETRAAVVEGFTIVGGSTEQGAILDQFNGGAILVNNASPTIVGCTFLGNVAGCWGGAVYAGPGSSPLIASSLFESNYSDDDGGGFFAWNDADPVIVNSVFVRNTAAVRGGAIAGFGGGRLTMVNLTVVENAAPIGSGIFASDESSLVNSIVWANTGDVAQILDWNFDNLAVAWSNVMGGYPGEHNVAANPRLLNDGFHLSGLSPCINAGAAFEQALSFPDIDGQPRTMGLRLDMGADEVRIGERAGPHAPRAGVTTNPNLQNP